MTKPSGIHLPQVPSRYKTNLQARPTSSPSGEFRRPIPEANAAQLTRLQSQMECDGPPPQEPVITHSRRGVSKPRYWLAGSSVLAGLLLLTDVTVRQPAVDNPVCQSVVQEAFLSRETLAQLIAIPERQPKAEVQQVVGEPYCRLAPVEVRAGVQAEREAYPLAFDANAWVVLLYEGEEYAGYDFKFPND